MNSDYKITKEQYTFLKKVNRFYYAPKTKELNICTELFQNSFISPVILPKNKHAYKLTTKGKIAIEQYKTETQTLSTAKRANVIAIIALGVAMLPYLIKVISIIVEFLQR